MQRDTTFTIFELSLRREDDIDGSRHLGAIWKIGDSLRSFRRRVLQSETMVRLFFQTFHPL